MGQKFTEVFSTLQIKPLRLAGVFYCLNKLLQQVAR